MKQSSKTPWIGLSGLVLTLCIGLFGPAALAQTYYFTQDAPTTLTTVNTYVTDAGGSSLFQFDGATGNFSSANAIKVEQNAAVLIHEYVTAGWTTPPFTGNFSLDEGFASFSGTDALWINPNNAPFIAAQPDDTTPLYVSAWGDGTWTISVTFEVDDINLYTGFFIEGRHYADDRVAASLNGQAITLPSVSQDDDWNWNPPATSKVFLSSALFQNGTNTLVFTIDNTNPESEAPGPSGLMAFGRLGADLIPEPAVAFLAGLAGLLLLGRRSRRRAE